MTKPCINPIAPKGLLHWIDRKNAHQNRNKPQRTTQVRLCNGRIHWTILWHLFSVAMVFLMASLAMDHCTWIFCPCSDLPSFAEASLQILDASVRCVGLDQHQNHLGGCFHPHFLSAGIFNAHPRKRHPGQEMGSSAQDIQDGKIPPET